MPLDEGDCAATYKILILGDASVGKSSILRCLTGQEFKDQLYPTITTDFRYRKFEIDGALVQLQLWDTAGQTRFHSMNRWQFKGVKGIAIVYDVTNVESFSNVPFWLQLVNAEISHSHNKYEVIPTILVGNKADLTEERQVPKQDGDELADETLIFGHFETSARTGDNIFIAFNHLAYHVTDICDPKCMKSYHPNMIRYSSQWDTTSKGRNSEESSGKSKGDKSNKKNKNGKDKEQERRAIEAKWTRYGEKIELKTLSTNGKSRKGYSKDGMKTSRRHKCKCIFQCCTGIPRTHDD
ncbi:hypothetical protein CHS0354_003452 [Potamilus streckersoni]|uniref:Uncharacterized protein n=1 Tax=Potamilus streckersoni TaxID=2493646 RepID=A0AAE0SPK8_9BIVA|nr:hypothetical protein CHS0354_003452 [Potamilus streckersoni]